MEVNENLKRLYIKLAESLVQKSKDDNIQFDYVKIMGSNCITRRIIDKGCKIMYKIEEKQDADLLDAISEITEAFTIESIKAYPLNQYMYQLYTEASKRILTRMKISERTESVSSDDEKGYMSTDISSRKRKVKE